MRSAGRSRSRGHRAVRRANGMADLLLPAALSQQGRQGQGLKRREQGEAGARGRPGSIALLPHASHLARWDASGQQHKVPWFEIGSSLMPAVRGEGNLPILRAGVGSRPHAGAPPWGDVHVWFFQTPSKRAVHVIPLLWKREREEDILQGRLVPGCHINYCCCY